MSPLWHIVRKDARRLRLPLAVWAILITFHHAADWWLHHLPTDDALRLQWMKGFTMVLFALRLGVGYVLAAGIVMEDPAAGTTAFWKSRPISGARMLSAKVLGCVVLLVAAPSCLGLPWWWVGSEGDVSWLISLGQMLRWHVAAVGVGMAVAAFSTTVGQFLFWTVVLQLASVVAIVTFTETNRLSLNVINASLRAAPWQLSFAGMMVLLTVAGALFAAYNRRPGRTIISTFVVGAALAGIVLLHVLA